MNTMNYFYTFFFNLNSYKLLMEKLYNVYKFLALLNIINIIKDYNVITNN
jgi:hypothetical protein